jgi:hypothetical protein
MPSSSFPCSAVATTKVCKVHPKKHKKTKDSQVSILWVVITPAPQSILVLLEQVHSQQ